MMEYLLEGLRTGQENCTPGQIKLRGIGRGFCEDAKSIPEAARLHKILARDLQVRR